jgi:hypothetical protein
VINKYNAFPLEYLMICNELKLRTGENREGRDPGGRGVID